MYRALRGLRHRPSSRTRVSAAIPVALGSPLRRALSARAAAVLRAPTSGGSGGGTSDNNGARAGPANAEKKKYNVAELFGVSPRLQRARLEAAAAAAARASDDTADAGGGTSGGNSGGGSGGGARARRWTETPFVRAGLPLILLVLGGTYGLSYLTVNRVEQSNRQRSGMDAAAKGASKELPASVYSAARANPTPKPSMAQAMGLAGAADASGNGAATGAAVAASSSGAGIAIPTRVSLEPGVGGGLADGSELPRVTRRVVHDAKALGGDDVNSMNAELERLRRELKWDQGYEVKRVARPKGREQEYMTGIDPERAATSTAQAKAQR